MFLTTVCRPAVDACDVPEFCDGRSATCPENRFAPAGTICLASRGECETAGTCNASGQCGERAFLTGVCRPAANSCDVPESCTGSSPTCPENTFQPNGTPCNSDNNLCTQETCQSGVCQAGSPVPCPPGQTCVPATGICQCTTGVTCGNLCCTGSSGFCCPTGTPRAGQCRRNLAACGS